MQLEYVQPGEIIRSEDDPILSELTGTIVVKTSWPGTDRRSNEASMYRDSAGRFGTIPHVCSYGGMGGHGEVISNILFVPQEGDVERYHWPIFTDVTPRKPEVRTLGFTVFSTEGKSLVEVKSPRQLSRSWAHSLLGAFVDTLRISLTDSPIPQDGCRYTCLAICTGTSVSGTSLWRTNLWEGKGSKYPRGLGITSNRWTRGRPVRSRIFASKLKRSLRSWESQISVLGSSRMATLQSPGNITGMGKVEQTSL